MRIASPRLARSRQKFYSDAVAGEVTRAGCVQKVAARSAAPGARCRRGTTGAGRGPGRGGWRGPCCWGRCSGWRAGSCRPRPPPAPAAAARPRTWEARQRAAAAAAGAGEEGEEVGLGGRHLPCSAHQPTEPTPPPGGTDAPPSAARRRRGPGAGAVGGRSAAGGAGAGGGAAGRGGAGGGVQQEPHHRGRQVRDPGNVLLVGEAGGGAELPRRRAGGWRAGRPRNGALPGGD